MKKFYMASQRRRSSVMSTSSLHKFKNKKDGTIMINQYSVIKKLGEGSFAKVLLCKDNNTDNLYAIKVMNKKQLKQKKTGQGKTAYDCIYEELKVMERLDHPHITFLYEIIDDSKKENIYLVTDYHSKGSLGDLVLKKNKKYDDHN